MPQKTQFKQRTLDLLFIALTAVFVFSPLLDHRFFWSHDEAQLLWRITEIHANITHGHPFCRWFPDFARGLGLPFLEFFPVFFLYFNEIFKLAGAGTILSAKISIVMITLFGSWSVYLLANELWGRRAGLLSAVLFTYVPYRLFDLYVRGDVNEFTAMAFLPFNLWAITRYLTRPVGRPLSLFLILGGFCVFTAHYPSAVIQLPIYIFWIISLRLHKKATNRTLIGPLVSLGIGLLLSAPWWTNAILNKHLVQMEGMTRGFADYRQQFIYPVQWFSNYWNFGASVKGPGDTISFQLGNIALLCAVLGFPFWRKRIKASKKYPVSMLPLFVLLAVSLFLTTAASRFVWERIPLLPMLQFPYRLLQVPALVLSLIGGTAMHLTKSRRMRWNGLFLVLLSAFIIWGSHNMYRVAAYLDLTDADLSGTTIRRVAHTHCTGEFIPRPVGKRFPPKEPFKGFKIEKIPPEGYTRAQMEGKLRKMLQHASEIKYWEGTTLDIGPRRVVPGTFSVLSGNAIVNDNKSYPVDKKLSIRALTKTTILWAQFYFPGWSGLVDGKKLQLSPDPQTGLIAFSLPPGRHNITLRYENLPLANYLTYIVCAVSVLLLLLNIPFRMIGL